MGLERIATIVQGGDSNYDNDLFRQLMDNIVRTIGVGNRIHGMDDPSLRVIADHARSAAFLIADGVMPGNEERAYVLRRIVRRGLRHGHKLGRARAVLPSAGRCGGRRDGRCLSGARRPRRAHSHDPARRGAPFRSHIEVRPRALESRHRRPRQRQDHSRRSGVQTVRHLRLPSRHDGGRSP